MPGIGSLSSCLLERFRKPDPDRENYPDHEQYASQPPLMSEVPYIDCYRREHGERRNRQSAVVNK